MLNDMIARSEEELEQFQVIHLLADLHAHVFLLNLQLLIIY